MSDNIKLKTANNALFSSAVFSKEIEFALFYVYVFLAFFHIPLFWIEEDSIGLFDFYQLLYLLIMLTRRNGNGLELPTTLKSYLVIVLLYLCFLLVEYVLVYNSYITALLIKQVQYFAGLVIVFSFFTRYTEYTEKIIFNVQLIFLLMVIFAILNYFSVFNRIGLGELLGYGRKERLGLPLKLGTSSNPAGFVMSVYLLFAWLVMARQYRRNVITVVTIIASFVALILTLSRTNIFALSFVMLIVLTMRMFKNNRYFFTSLFILAVIVVSIIIAIEYLPRENKVWRVIQYIQNPSGILTDSSLRVRYAFLWAAAIRNWLENPLTFLFGKGVGYLTIVDGTFFRLLGNQGIIGLVFFIYVWIIHYITHYRSNKAVILLMVFIIINGISGDTLIVSYRSMQIYVIFLGMFIFSHNNPDKLKQEYNSKSIII